MYIYREKENLEGKVLKIFFIKNMLYEHIFVSSENVLVK